MSVLSNVKIINHFAHNGDNYGEYTADYEGKTRLFIQNGNSVAILCHKLYISASKCLDTVRDDVRDELTTKVAKIEEATK